MSNDRGALPFSRIENAAGRHPWSFTRPMMIAQSVDPARRLPCQAARVVADCVAGLRYVA
jgi:hypothetical protein